MGDEADALSEQYEDGGNWHPRRVRQKRRSFTSYAVPEMATTHHPANDMLARELIEKLGTYVWVTHKVSGRYTTSPYSLSTLISGKRHVIHLPGRRGSTLMWLKGKIEKLELEMSTK